MKSVGKQNGRWMSSAIILAVLFLAIESRELVFAWPTYRIAIGRAPEVVRWLEQPFRWMLIVVMGMFLLGRMQSDRSAAGLGFVRPILAPALFALLATSPMWLTGLLAARLSANARPFQLFFLAGVWPLAEEVLYRGFAFHHLHRSAGWKLWPAALATGLVFAVVHLANTSVRGLPLSEQVGVIAITSIGGLLFAWLFSAWGDNLWAPFALHGAMNLWWNVFDVSESPVGNLGTNILRGLSVLLAIVLTIWRDRLRVFSLLGARPGSTLRAES